MAVKPSNKFGGKDFGGCGLIGIIDTSGTPLPGGMIISSLCTMKERGNGLGSGYAIYGVYPDFREHYAMHLMYSSDNAIPVVEEHLKENLEVIHSEPIPVRRVGAIQHPPSFWRYFVNVPEKQRGNGAGQDTIVRVVMEINEKIENAYVLSSGKNMAVFKGVGHPDEIADFFRVDEYSGHTLIGHNRFPTNTPGWWGGAHPFTILDWAIVHNGELSSYGTNKRYVEMYGYKCALLTDTEVVAYLFDLLIRRKGLSLEASASVMAPPFWKNIQEMGEPQKSYYTALRTVYGSAALNGPFAIVMGFNGGIMGFNDRIKLRPLVVGKKGDVVAIASEESAIREVINDPEDIHVPRAGEPVIVRLKDAKK
ncbi:MAG TPA: glutamine amidotransferase family protein [bacterium]